MTERLLNRLQCAGANRQRPSDFLGERVRKLLHVHGTRDVDRAELEQLAGITAHQPSRKMVSLTPEILSLLAAPWFPVQARRALALLLLHTWAIGSCCLVDGKKILLNEPCLDNPSEVALGLEFLLDRGVVQRHRTTLTIEPSPLEWRLPWMPRLDGARSRILPKADDTASVRDTPRFMHLWRIWEAIKSLAAF